MLAALRLYSIYAWTLLDTQPKTPTYKNPILGPIFAFFASIWTGLTDMWYAFTGAIGTWFKDSMDFQYNGIPVGPLLLIGVAVMAFLIVWGFVKFKEMFMDE